MDISRSTLYSTRVLVSCVLYESVSGNNRRTKLGVYYSSLSWARGICVPVASCGQIFVSVSWDIHIRLKGTVRRNLRWVKSIGGHRHRSQCRRYPISDIDICYSDIGDKYVGLKNVIPISEEFRYRHQRSFRYPTLKKKISATLQIRTQDLCNV